MRCSSETQALRGGGAVQCEVVHVCSVQYGMKLDFDMIVQNYIRL